jgi:hypothetical protein
MDGIMQVIERMAPEKRQIIEEILDLELEMFLSVNAREKAACQEDPDGFRFYRGCMFSVWSLETLMSYRDDVLRAKEEGRNLVTLKYARMEDLIPQQNDSELIEKIVEIQIRWTREMAVKYPHVQSQSRPIEDDSPQSTSTKTYLRGELETYSESTLELHHRDLLESIERGENLSAKMCAAMVEGAGFSSLEAAEESLALRSKGGNGIVSDA